MSATQHEFADAEESAAFLYSEGDAENGKGRRAPKPGLWTRIGRVLPYLLLVLGILLGIYVVLISPSTHNHEPAQAMFGRIPMKQVTFQPDPSFDVDPFGPDELDSPWTKLPPIGKGHINVHNPASYGLSGGYPLPDGKGEEYTVALFHQLHCLAAIKAKMSRLQDWYEGGNDNEYLRFALGEDQVADVHIYHCFDYLRQTLLCHGDTTLEKARVVDDGLGHTRTVRGVDGWGVTHTCRDYDSIYAFAEQHRSRNDTGID
ncbi:hypothetical protein SEUCBS140593_009910 [Sporothrix eucalyptigena]|uniref:Tat pathway signal sequence n=1 Tax=Sporothrix eucalyptigena TaxID=1812306 RepID=A0ABP0CYZ8_9PEZI